jgi:hypothetical protein
MVNKGQRLKVLLTNKEVTSDFYNQIKSLEFFEDELIFWEWSRPLIYCNDHITDAVMNIIKRCKIRKK